MGKFKLRIYNISMRLLCGGFQGVNIQFH